MSPANHHFLGGGNALCIVKGGLDIVPGGKYIGDLLEKGYEDNVQLQKHFGGSDFKIFDEADQFIESHVVEPLSGKTTLGIVKEICKTKT